MAEALVNHLYPGDRRAAGRVHPKSIETLQRHGINRAFHEAFRLLETRIRRELA